MVDCTVIWVVTTGRKIVVLVGTPVLRLAVGRVTMMGGVGVGVVLGVGLGDGVGVEMGGASPQVRT